MLRSEIMLLTAVVVVLATPSLWAQACANIDPGPIPTSYLNGTNKCSFGSDISPPAGHCSDNNGKEVEFDAAIGGAIQKVIVMDVGSDLDDWATWNLPPLAEDRQPDVGFTNFVDTLTLTLTRPQFDIGFEIESNDTSAPFHGITVTAVASDGVTVLTSDTQNQSGNGGSQRFGAVCGARAIKYVNITCNLFGSTDCLGFAIAQIRSSGFAGFPVAPHAPKAPLGPPRPGITQNYNR